MWRKIRFSVFMIQIEEKIAKNFQINYCYRVLNAFYLYQKHLCVKFNGILLYLPSAAIIEIHTERNITDLTQDRFDTISLRCNKHKNSEVIFLLIMLERMEKGMELVVKGHSMVLIALQRQSIIRNKSPGHSSTIKHSLVYFV